MGKVIITCIITYCMTPMALRTNFGKKMFSNKILFGVNYGTLCTKVTCVKNYTYLFP